MNAYYDTWFEFHPEWRDYADLSVVPPSVAEAIEDWPELEHSEIGRHPDVYSRFGVTRLAIYVMARRKGQTHRFAEMVATQRPPRCMTDDVFFAGLKPWGDAMAAPQKKKLLALARARGFEPPPEAIYQSGLARFPGDPEAFVTRGQGRGYIKQLCEQRGWACEGAVNVPAREPEKDMLDQRNCIPLAENLVRSKAREMIRENPGLKSLPAKKLREKVIERYGPTS